MKYLWSNLSAVKFSSIEKPFNCLFYGLWTQTSSFWMCSHLHMSWASLWKWKCCGYRMSFNWSEILSSLVKAKDFYISFYILKSLGQTCLLMWWNLKYLHQFFSYAKQRKIIYLHGIILRVWIFWRLLESVANLECSVARTKKWLIFQRG